MDERVMQFRVGVMVVATLIITAILVLVFNDVPGSLGASTYTIFIRLPQAPNVTKDTPIRKSGVLIGRVSEVQLRDEGGVIVTARIEANRKLFTNERCRINSTLLGDASLQVYVPPNKRGEPVKEGDTLEGEPAPDPLEMINNFQQNFAGAVDSISSTSGKMRDVAERLDRILARNETKIERTLEEASVAMASMRKALDNVNDVIAEPEVRQRLKEAMNQVPALLSDTRQAVVRLRRTMDLVDQNLANFENFTRPLGQYGDTLVKRIDATAENLDTLTAEIGRFARNLNTSEGSLGMLLNNPDLYQNANRAVLRLDELLKELRPIIDDARVFTDKIARHPESLGVKGAMERRPGIK